MTATQTSITIEGRQLIAGFLEEQGQLTAVDRFAQRHERGNLPAHEKYYRDLIPMDRPADGQQYAFEVDLDACTGCKACVSSCHNLNGLEEGETWRDVGQLVGGPLDEAIAQHVTAACHHCLEPACLDGCPVKAYEKDPVTGIVKHLDDQCIGCQYCTLKCPYDVPKYSKEKGIVRKCDMCSDRLAEGEAPACAQACPTGAIAIRIVDQEEMRQRSETNQFLSGAPDPDYTLPTTQYKTRRDLSGARPADYYTVSPEHAHPPLVIMLVLTQLSVGGFLIGSLLEWLTGSGVLSEAMRPIHAAVSLALGLVALGASTLHLGRPLYAFRAVIGLGTSWLSREIVAFGGFAKLAMAYAAVCWLAPDLMGGAVRIGLYGSVIGIGLVGVFCSAMIYHDTRRVLWRLDRTGVRFSLTALLLGTASTLLAGLLSAGWSANLTVAQFMSTGGAALCVGLAGITALKLLHEAVIFRHLRDADYTPLKRTAVLMSDHLHQATLARFAVGAIGGIALPAVLAAKPGGESDVIFTCLALGAVFALTLIGELLERYLFFAAVVAPKMPGTVSP